MSVKNTLPNLEIEKKLQKNVIGVDEAGRGPLAGPVVAAAVIIPKNFNIEGINDSKKLTAAKREALYIKIKKECIYSIKLATVEEIYEHNILEATKLAMRRAVEDIYQQDYHIIIDGNMNPMPSHYKKVTPIIKGDTKSLTIATASILAKVYRDYLMTELNREFPQYNWKKNKGYGTKEHIDSIIKYGITNQHRKMFLRKI